MELSQAGAYYSRDLSLYYNHGQVMGTRLDVIFQGQDSKVADNAFAGLMNELFRLDKMMNKFDEYSQVSMINKLAYIKTLNLDKELFNILLKCKEYHKRTSGLFDISLGNLADIVKSGRIENSDIQITELIENTGMDNLLLEENDSSVRFLKPEMNIDLGGFGKGYALDCIRSLLKSNEISNAFISFGHSSVMALGNHPQGSGWRAGIQHIYKPLESVYSFDLHNESVSTSGPNPLAGDLSNPSHVIHPGKGMVKNRQQHISVKSASATDAEVLSTALLIADAGEIQAMLSAFHGCHAIGVDYDSEGKSSIRELNY